MNEFKEWEKKINQLNKDDNLYVVTVGKDAITARKINGEYINSVTGENIKLPNVYKTRKIKCGF
tara:strand:+ start:92 stop:283 length:192 start_codon:yes stop_codon:yes gene_type:complete